MKFCKECESLLFPKEIDKELKYVCNVCGGVEDFTDYIIDTTVYKEQEKSRIAVLGELIAKEEKEKLLKPKTTSKSKKKKKKTKN